MLEEMTELQQEASLGATAFIIFSLTVVLVFTKKKAQILMNILLTQIYFKKERLKLCDIALFSLKQESSLTGEGRVLNTIQQ